MSQDVDDPDSKPWPILMQPQDIIFLPHAADRAKRTERTVRRWCQEFAIGRQSSTNARWEISAPALEMVIYNDLDALKLLREGERTHPRVVRYFDHLGISPEVGRRR